MSETRTTTTLTSMYPSSAKRNGDLASFEERVAAVRDYFAGPRFDGIVRLYTAGQVVEQQGSAPMDFPVAREAALASSPSGDRSRPSAPTHRARR